MSRIGKTLITIPDGIIFEFKDRVVSIKGPLGSDSCKVCEGIEVKQEKNILFVKANNVESNDKTLNAMHGLYRSLIANIVTGVSKGFSKDLVIQGVGYRAQQQGKDIEFLLGFSHPIVFKAPEGITLAVLEQTKVQIKGINKQQVGQVAANIRKLRPPEPYKGKGIKYSDEIIRRKAGKTGK